MTAAELLVDLARQGFTLAHEGYDIRVTPASRLTGELRQVIRAHKPALLALLAERRAPAFVWEQAEADRLLAELRAEVVRLGREEFRSAPPEMFRTLAADLVAIGEGYVRGHEMEAARGWDALDLLRGLRPLLQQTAGRIKQMVAQGRCE